MNLRPMLMSDADFMLELKNYPETREFAIKSHQEIKKEDHYKWLEENLQYFQIIQGTNNSIGAIRIQDNEISIWIDRNFWGKGYATSILKKIKNSDAYAKIVNGNVASLRAFVRAGFVPIDYENNFYILKKAIREIKCANCGKKVKVSPSHEGRKKYCSAECKSKNSGYGVGYTALHYWVERQLGKAIKCEDCGRTDPPKGKTKYFHWSNISGEYKRDITDWRQRCVLCHHKFDGKLKFTPEQILDIRRRHKNGEFQYVIAADYGVSKTTILHIVNNKTKSYADIK